MQYIKLRYQTDEVDLFSDEDMDGNVPVSYTHLPLKNKEKRLDYIGRCLPKEHILLLWVIINIEHAFLVLQFLHYELQQ